MAPMAPNGGSSQDFRFKGKEFNDCPAIGSRVIRRLCSQDTLSGSPVGHCSSCSEGCYRDISGRCGPREAASWVVLTWCVSDRNLGHTFSRDLVSCVEFRVVLRT